MQEKKGNALIWLRNDLRIEDQASFYFASNEYNNVIAYYSFDPQFFSKNHFFEKKCRRLISSNRGLIWKSVAVAYAVAYAVHDSQPDWLWTRLLIVGYTSVQIRVHQYTSVQISIHQYTSVSISTHQYTIAHNSGPMRGICHMRMSYAAHMPAYVICAPSCCWTQVLLNPGSRRIVSKMKYLLLIAFLLIKSAFGLS